MDDENVKRALKEALKEWLDEKYASFGRWSLGAVSAGALFALVYFMLRMNGWTRLG